MKPSSILGFFTRGGKGDIAADKVDDLPVKKAVVIGGGVVGISSAWELAKKGYSVLVLEKSAGPANECSAVAAGGCQRANPLVNRSNWKDVFWSTAPFLSSATSKDMKFFNVQWRATLSDPHFFRWLSDFSYNSLAEPSVQYNRQQHMLGFTNWAVSYLQDFMEQRGMEKHCGLNRLGALKVIYGAEAGGKALSLSSLEKSVELDCKQLLDLEPSLKHRQEMGLPTRGVLEPNAAAANGEIFAHELAKIATAEGKVKFMYGTAVHSMEEGPRTEGGHRQITALQLSAGQRLSVDPNTEVIVAAGAWTPQLMWGVGMYTPIYPMKGYCIALQVPAGVPEDHLPQRIVYDKYTYVSRLGDQVRITSIGEFAGWDTKPTPEVDKSLRAAAKRQLPALADLITETHTRCGLRPFSADGIILLGRVQPFQNLSINCGPGFNGWKTALGAGRVLADIVAGGGKDEKDFDASFLSPSGRMKQAPLLSRISLKRWT